MDSRKAFSNVTDTSSKWGWWNKYIINNLKFQAIMIVQIRRIVAGIKDSYSYRRAKCL